MTTKQDKTIPLINEIYCDNEVYKKGSVFEILDIPKEKANEYCIQLSKEDKSHIYDWHYFGGRVVVKRLEREFLRKEEKEEDKTIIELYSKNGYVPFISNIEAKKVYKGDFDMFFKLLINGKHINKGYGIYIFEASLTDKIGEFNFKLIDFKPLEEEVK